MRILRNPNRREINVLQIRTAVKISIYPIGNKSVQKRHKLLGLFKPFSHQWTARNGHCGTTSLVPLVMLCFNGHKQLWQLIRAGGRDFSHHTRTTKFQSNRSKTEQKKVEFTGNLTRNRRLRETIRWQTCADTDNFRLLKVSSFSSINYMKLFTWLHPE